MMSEGVEVDVAAKTLGVARMQLVEAFNAKQALDTAKVDRAKAILKSLPSTVPASLPETDRSVSEKLDLLISICSEIRDMLSSVNQRFHGDDASPSSETTDFQRGGEERV